MRILILLILTSFTVAAPRPKLAVYHFDRNQNVQVGLFTDKIAEIKKARRLFQRLTKQKINLRISYIEGMLLTSFFGCQFWSSTPSSCLWGIYDELIELKRYNPNKTSHFFVIPPVWHQGSYWIGGAAITGCYKDHKWKRQENYLSGIAYGNFLKTQTNGTTRIPQSIAIMMHEWGHLVFGLSHDGEEENYLMNSLFNVKGFSSLSAPELWRISEKSKKEIRRCKGA